METSEIRDLLSNIHDKVSRHELQKQLTVHTQPLLTSLSALEKTISITTTTNTSSHKEVIEQLRHIQHQQDRIESSTLLQYNVDSLQHLIRDKIQEFHQFHQQDLFNNPTIKSLVDHTVAQNNDYLLRQIQTSQEGIRLEVTSSSKQEIELEKQFLHSKLFDFQTSLTEQEEKYSKLKRILKELSTNVAKSLSKKIEFKEVSKLVEKQWEELQIQHSLGDLKNKKKKGEDAEEEFDQLLSSLSRKPTVKTSRTSASRRHVSSGDDDEEDIEGDEEYYEAQEEHKERHQPTRSQSAPRNRPSSTTSTGGRVLPVRQQMNQLVTEVQQTKSTVSQLQKDLKELLRNKSTASPSRVTSTSTGSFKEQLQQQDVDRYDWRIALGDMAMNLRSELVDKCSREEMYSAMRSNSQDVLVKVKACEDQYVVAQQKANEQVVSFQQEVTNVKNKVASELTGAR